MGEDVRTEGYRPFNWDEDREESPSSSNHICAQCEDDIDMGEECFLIQVVQPQKLGEMHYYAVIDEFDDNQDYLFEPYHFCFSCWEDLLETLKGEVEDLPPVEDVMSVVECSCCGSGIREWEYSVTYTLGEFLRSTRAPAPACHHEPKFHPNGKPEVLCRYCAALLNEVAITMWEDFSQDGECIDCMQVRCWRYGETCQCSCHEGEKNG